MSDTPTVWEALNNVKTAIGAVGKGERNTAQGFNFRGVDSVVNAAAPHLNKYGVVVTPEVVEHAYETVEIGKNKTPMAHVIVIAKYTFWGPAGDCVSSTVLAEAMDSGDKACAKAMSVAYRIALLQTLNLPTDEPDPDSESFVRESSNVTPLRQTRKVSRPEVITNWPMAIEGASSIERLREVWKQAGSAGVLQNPVVSSSGEKMTTQELLYKRSDQLSTSKSTS